MTLLEQLERHEARRRFPYPDSVGKLTIGLFDVTPTIPADHGPNARRTDSISGRKVFARDVSEGVELTDLAHLPFGQLCHVLARFALRALLESCRVGVSHLLAHRRQFQIRHAVVAAVAVLVVDGHAGRDRAYEVFVDQSMNERTNGCSVAVSPERDASVAAFLECDWSVGAAPEPAAAPHFTVAADYVEVFKASDRFPHWR